MTQDVGRRRDRQRRCAFAEAEDLLFESEASRDCASLYVEAAEKGEGRGKPAFQGADRPTWP